MDQELHIIDNTRASDPGSLRRAISEIRAAHGISETSAYAMLVRAAASGSPVEPVDRRTETLQPTLLAS